MSNLDQAQITSLIPSETARRFRVVPSELKAKILTVFTEDPENWKLMDILRFRTGYEIQMIKKEGGEMDKLLEAYYPRERSVVEELSEELQKEGKNVLKAGKEVFGPQVHSLGGTDSLAPVVRWVNRVLTEGIRIGASDIHFECCEEAFRVRVCRDGKLYELERLPKKIAEPVISRIKVMASLNTAESRLPQDGRIQVSDGFKGVDFRVSTLPTLHGESVVLRILDQSAKALKLSDIGFENLMIDNLRRLVGKPNGMVLVTGPTGSGKTTTLYGCLSEVDRKSLKVITVEDPVEYELDRVVQVPVREKIGLGFSTILRSILRHDPDLVMVGEIRDEETAKISLQASLTGHLVLATLHTNDAPGAITRLGEMGLEPFLIASTLRGVLAQRLMRKLCPDCRQPLPEGSPILDSLEEFSTVSSSQIYEAKGCEKCHGFGYAGRVAVGEFLEISPRLRELISKGEDLETLRKVAREEGMLTLPEMAKAKVLEGTASLEEYLRFRTSIETKSGGAL